MYNENLFFKRLKYIFYNKKIILIYLKCKFKDLLCSRLIQNIGALAIVQAIGYFIPFITLPYLTRTLGPAEWGQVVWMQVILGYFSILTDWGFSWSGTRKVAAYKHDIDVLSEIFLASWIVQFVLSIISVFILILCVFLFSPFEQFKSYTLYGSIIIISSVLYPVWLLTGLELMREIALMQFVTKISAVPLIFMFVRKSGDGNLVIFIGALTGFFGGGLSLFWLWRRKLLRWKFPKISSVIEEFLDGGSIFISRIWIVLYTSLIPSILGVMVGVEAVGQFVLANRIRMAVQSLLSPVSQALFPRMSYLFAHDRKKAIELLWRSSGIILVLSLIAGLFLSAFSGKIILLLAGDKFKDSIIILKLMSPLLFIVSISNIFGIQILLPNLKIKIFNNILASAGIISLALIWILLFNFGIYGAAINFLIVETFVSVLMFVFVYLNKNEIFKL